MDGRRALVILPNDPDLVDILAANNVDISVSEGEQQGNLVSLLGNLIFPLLAFGGLFYLFQRAGNNGQVRSLHRAWLPHRPRPSPRPSSASWVHVTEALVEAARPLHKPQVRAGKQAQVCRWLCAQAKQHSAPLQCCLKRTSSSLLAVSRLSLPQQVRVTHAPAAQQARLPRH